MYNNQKRPVSASLVAFIIAAIDRVVNIFLSSQTILPIFVDNAQQFLVKKSLRHMNYGQINDYHLPPLQLQSGHGSINMLLKT